VRENSRIARKRTQRRLVVTSEPLVTLRKGRGPSRVEARYLGLAYLAGTARPTLSSGKGRPAVGQRSGEVNTERKGSEKTGKDYSTPSPFCRRRMYGGSRRAVMLGGAERKRNGGGRIFMYKTSRRWILLGPSLQSPLGKPTSSLKKAENEDRGKSRLEHGYDSPSP